jgi:hypothetical protein
MRTLSEITVEPQEIIASIKSYIISRRGDWNDWYIGITKNLLSRLRDHGVRLEQDIWIAHRAASSESARAIEAHFLIIGCDGGPGGGDAESCFVYAYAKGAQTRP